MCVLCGVNKAINRDHVPPKSIFAEPRPANLITVPACKECNNKASPHDESFKIYLGFHVAKAFTPETDKAFKIAKRSFLHNRKIRKNVFKSMKPVDIISKGGVIVDRGYKVPWDNEAHDAVIERTVRGLFFHHFGKILGNRAEVRTMFFEERPDFLDQYAFKFCSIASPTFYYAYTKVEDSELSSIWLFNFYGSHWAGGITIDKKDLEEV